MWAKIIVHIYFMNKGVLFMAKKKSTTNKIRLTVCGLYIAQIFFLTSGYIRDFNNATVYHSCFATIFYSIKSGVVEAAIQSIVVALIPIIGFFIFSFDKKRNIKNIYGVLSSVVEVFLIIGMTNGLANLGWGSTIAIILYFPIVFLSSMSIFSNIVDAKNKATYSNR